MISTVIGFDPGPELHGWALLRVDSGRPVFLRKGQVDVKDTGAILSLIEDADVVGVETPKGIPYVDDTDHSERGHHKAKGRIKGKAEQLLATGVEAGILLGMARCYEVEVVRACAEVWRKAIVGRSGPEDWQVKVAVAQRIPTWPDKSNAHERDAAGMAIYAYERARLGALGVAS